MEAVSFGPVPSRRLGASLGINNITPKICSYSCIYCQLGSTIKLTSERMEFHDPQRLVNDVEERIGYMKEKGERIDYLTFVPDGEPTLDSNLGREIRMLKETGIRVAVITNSSLLWKEDVKSDLMEADWISLKVDTVSEAVWRKMNRPHNSILLTKILDAEKEFSRQFGGTLTTETMVVETVNDDISAITDVSEFISDLSPRNAYISIPTRPPAEKWVRPPDEEKINEIFQVFSGSNSRVEYLTGYEGNEFSFKGDIASDILAITSVHPMRREAVEEMLLKTNSSWELIESLISEGKLKEVEYRGIKFYVRKFDF